MMRTLIFRILFVVTLIIVILAWKQPIVSMVDKTRLNNELKEKQNERDSLGQVIERIKNNPEEKRKEARRSGYSKNDEMMLKIITPDIEKESEKIKTNVILLLSALITIILVAAFAFSTGHKNISKGDVHGGYGE